MPTNYPKKIYDSVILGAGGAGLFCARTAGLRSKSVLILDHSRKIGGKILISGGGRCNFTNLGASPAQYASENPHFCKSALARYSPHDFVALVEKHGIAYHEKKLGQQFCDDSAQQIVDLLVTEARDAGAEIQLECKIGKIEVQPSTDTTTSTPPEKMFLIETSHGRFAGRTLVVATGGLSIPKIGATGLGYEIAKQFGLKLIPTRPALDGFVFARAEAERFGDLTGLSADTLTTAGGLTFRENILFTHAGLSGPATLQASLHWSSGETVTINLLPDLNSKDWFIAKKKAGSKTLLKNHLSELLPARLAERFFEIYFPSSAQFSATPINQIPDQAIAEFSQHLHAWTFVPAGTVGYSKAEVTRGGVDTNELSSKTMEAKKIPGLYFIGEVVDVTGWLGGYNFQWAWASAHAAGQAI